MPAGRLWAISAARTSWTAPSMTSAMAWAMRAACGLTGAWHRKGLRVARTPGRADVRRVGPGICTRVPVRRYRCQALLPRAAVPLSLPRGAGWVLAGRGRCRRDRRKNEDPMSTFHPGLKRGRFIPKVSFGRVSSRIVRRVKWRATDPGPDVTVQEIVVPGPKGAPPVSLRVFQPAGLTAAAPALLLDTRRRADLRRARAGRPYEHRLRPRARHHRRRGPVIDWGRTIPRPPRSRTPRRAARTGRARGRLAHRHRSHRDRRCQRGRRHHRGLRAARP